MAQQVQSEIRYLTPPSVDVKKKKYCRFKKSGIKYLSLIHISHLSNQPLQNSEHISGLSGRSFFSGANCWSMLAPVPKFMVHTRSWSPFLVKLDAQ